MKKLNSPPAALFALLLTASLYQLAHAQEAPDPSQEDYAYLTRMHVPEPVIRCVAAFDKWVALTALLRSM